MQAVLDYLNQNQNRFVSELCQYVRFPSVSAQPDHRHDLQACAEWVLTHCRQIGLDARLCPTKGNPIIVAKTPRATVSSPSPHDEGVGRGLGRGVSSKHSTTSRRPHFVIYGHYD